MPCFTGTKCLNKLPVVCYYCCVSGVGGCAVADLQFQVTALYTRRDIIVCSSTSRTLGLYVEPYVRLAAADTLTRISAFALCESLACASTRSCVDVLYYILFVSVPRGWHPGCYRLIDHVCVLYLYLPVPVVKYWPCDGPRKSSWV